MWFAFAGSQSRRDHIPDACLLYEREMQMSSLYKQLKGVPLGLPGWGLKITTHVRLAVTLHPYELEQSVRGVHSSPVCHTPSNHGLLGWQGGGAAPPGQPLFSQGHIPGKVEEVDVPDLTQHELRLHFS